MMRLAEPSTAPLALQGPSPGSCRLAYSNPVLPWAELAQVVSMFFYQTECCIGRR